MGVANQQRIKIKVINSFPSTADEDVINLILTLTFVCVCVCYSIVFCAAIFLVSGAPRTQIDEDEWTFDKEGVAAADQPGRTDSPIFEYDYYFVLT